MSEKCMMMMIRKMTCSHCVLCSELQQCFSDLTDNEECRVVILTGAGKNFTAGLDVVDFAQDFFNNTSSDNGLDVARRAMKLKRQIKSMQNSFTSLEKVSCLLYLKTDIIYTHSHTYTSVNLRTYFLSMQCPKPVIAVVQGACVGGGVDMISACDVRYCTSNAFFQIKVSHKYVS